MIGLTTPVFDLDGAILINETHNQSAPTLSRRLSRTATLDGGSEITDLGFSDGDRTFIFETVSLSKNDGEQLEYLLQTYPLLILSHESGCYLGALDNLDLASYPQKMTFLVKEKLSS